MVRGVEPSITVMHEFESIKLPLAISAFLHLVMLGTPWAGGHLPNVQAHPERGVRAPVLAVSWRGVALANPPDASATSVASIAPSPSSPSASASASANAVTDGSEDPGEHKAMSATPSAATAPPSIDTVPLHATPDDGLGLAHLPPEYFATPELGKRPQPLANIDFDAPPLATIRANGTVSLTLWINKSGTVVKVDISQSSLPAALTGLVRAAFAEMRFVPGERFGQPVGTFMHIEVAFEEPQLAADPRQITR